MIFDILNWIAVIIAGAFWPGRRCGLLLALLGIVAAASLFLLGRVEARTTVDLLGRPYTLLELLPYPLVIAFLLMGRLSRWGLHVLGYVGVVLAIAIVAFLLKGRELGWAAYSVTVFVGPILLGVCVSTLDSRQAELLLRRLESLITGLGVLSIISVLAATAVAESMGWIRVPQRSASPVGSAIGTAGVILLLFPKAVNDVLRIRSRQCWLVLAILVLALLLSGSRAVVAVAGVTAMFVIIRAFLKSSTTWSFVRLGVLLVIVCAGTSAMVLSFDELRAVSRLTSTVGSLEGDKLRIMSAQAAIAQIGRDPVVGSVPGHTYPWFMTDYTSAGPWVTTVAGQLSLVEPHNLVLFLAVEYGVIPAVLLLFVIARAAIKLYRSGDEDLAMYGVSIVAYLMQTAGSTSLAIHPRIGTVFWMVVSAAVVIAGSRRRGRSSIVAASPRPARRRFTPVGVPRRGGPSPFPQPPAG